MRDHMWVIFPTFPLTREPIFLIRRKYHSLQSRTLFFYKRLRFFFSSWSGIFSFDTMIIWACSQDPHKRRVHCTQNWWVFILKPIRNRSSHQAYILVNFSLIFQCGIKCGLFFEQNYAPLVQYYLSDNCIAQMRPCWDTSSMMCCKN